AHPDDAPGAAYLIAGTDADLFRWYTRGDLDLWAAIAECEWRADPGIYSHTMSHVIRRQGEVVGLLVAYSSRRQATIDWSLAGSRARLGSARLSGIDLVQSPAAFLFPPLPEDAFYVQNVATAPSVRGRGLGRRLMERALELGRTEGCRTCHLDVDSSTQAVWFYEHLGFRPLVRTEVLTIPGVHAHYRMVVELS
ncbi:MAG: GNAT family N-acetyltransferase, partial [Isosphaerales bacterium]